jgi:hypothetical protein
MVCVVCFRLVYCGYSCILFEVFQFDIGVAFAGYGKKELEQEPANGGGWNGYLEY